MTYRALLRGMTIKFANLILEGLFVKNLYQLDKQSTKFTIWKYWKGCVKKLDGNDRMFCQQLVDLESRQCTCSYGTVFEGFLAIKQITVLEHPAYSRL